MWRRSLLKPDFGINFCALFCLWRRDSVCVAFCCFACADMRLLPLIKQIEDGDCSPPLQMGQIGHQDNKIAGWSREILTLTGESSLFCARDARESIWHSGDFHVRKEQTLR